MIANTLALGEIGSLEDLSSIANIIELLSSMFNSQSDQQRQAAAISLGGVSVGNTGFFLERVFA